MADILSTTSWCYSLKPNLEAKLRLFCFPYAGGNASLFRPWLWELPPEIDLCPILLPGRESRFKERPYTDLQTLIKALAPAIQPYLHLPFTFFGHSLGAIVSFELARHLRRYYKTSPVSLFVSGCCAPQLGTSRLPLHQLSDTELLKALQESQDPIDKILQHDELLHLLLPAIRADFTIYETYIYLEEKPLDCPITAFGGLQDSIVSQEALLAWQKQTSSTFIWHMFPGDHFFLSSNRAFLLHTLSQELLHITSQL